MLRTRSFLWTLNASLTNVTCLIQSRRSRSRTDAGHAVVQLHFSRALLADGWRSDVLLTLNGRKISAVASDVAPPAEAERIAGIAVPGLPNVHSHAFQRAMAGLAETRGPSEDSFWTWREVMYRFLAQMTPDDIEAVAALAYCEMLEAGFTVVGEFHYLHNDPDGGRYADPAETGARIAAAARTAGIGLTLLPSFYAHGGCGGQPARPGQKRFLSDIDGFADLMAASRRHVAAVDGANIGIAPHSLRAADAPELLALIRDYPGIPVHIHAAEQVAEVDECLAWSGARPVQWLLDHAPVDARWCLIHCTHMTDDEIIRLARSGAAAGLCPNTESSLGDGIFPGVAYQGAGGHFAVGTDSNIRIAVNEELRTLEYSQRLRDQKRNRLTGSSSTSTGRTVFDAALKGGTRALASDAGAIAVGRAADIVVLDDTHPSLVARDGDALLDGWIFAAANAVREVFAGGRRVVADGRHVQGDAIRRRYTETMQRLLARA
jgi:formimidoylglutamate deiminase